MKKLFFSLCSVFLFCSCSHEMKFPAKDYSKVPACPEFTFAKGVMSGIRGKSEASPIERGYLISKHPVTNAEYKKFCVAAKHETPSYWIDGKIPSGKAQHPVVGVSYEDALAYCDWYSAQIADWTFRLPTEAEWENAAAGPEHLKYSIGNSPDVHILNGEVTSRFNYNGVMVSDYLRQHANLPVTYIDPKSALAGKKLSFSDVVSLAENGKVIGWDNPADRTGLVYTDFYKQLVESGGYTTSVKHYPNAMHDLYGMIGNVWEWTTSEVASASGADSDEKRLYVRGGAWNTDLDICNTLYRGESRRPDEKDTSLGFRLVTDEKTTMQKIKFFLSKMIELKKN